MDRFFAPFGHDPDEPWFRVGTVDVTTTVLICALSVLSFFLYAIDRRIVEAMAMFPDDVRAGQVWRVLSWPIANVPDIWVLLTIVIFFVFGRDIERSLGRRRFLWFLAPLVVLPAALGVGVDIGFAGLRFLELGIFVAFIAIHTRAMSFFGVPLWVFGVVFIGLDVLQLLGARDVPGAKATEQLAILALVVVLGLLLARAFGLSDLEWIPRVPLPAFVSGQRRPAARPTPPQPGRPRGGRLGRRKGEATVTPIRPAGGKEATPSAADLLRQAEIDVLLDKINEHGITSLTPEERRRLDEHSRRLREERGS